MFQTLIVGLGRSGRGLHLPVLSRARAMPASQHLFDDRPIVTFDPWGTQADLPGAVLVRSLAQAGEMADPDRTVVHLCSLPATRVEVLEQLARLGFQKIVVEKPLAVDKQDLVEIARLRRRWNLDLVVVAPWLASALTHRILQTLRDGELGALRSVFVVQRKPRFTRSLVGCGHPTAFDIEMPHSVAVAVTIAGNANVCSARLSDMKFEDVVIPRLGSAWLSLDHESGVYTEIFSDLTSPTRERRITLKLERGTMIGHYSNSEADHTAQLSITASGRETRSVFHDDALTTFILRTYEHFAAPGHGSDDLTLNAEVVRLLSDAKRLCIASGQVGAGLLPCRYDRNGWGERAH
ncbi:MAG: oxidoreductase [Pseudonocardiaceae bacterium]